MNNLLKLIESSLKQIPNEFAIVITDELQLIANTINTPYTTITDEQGRGLITAENQTPQIRQFNEIINFASAY